MPQPQPVAQDRRASWVNTAHFLISVSFDTKYSIAISRAEGMASLPSLDRSCCSVQVGPRQVLTIRQTERCTKELEFPHSSKFKLIICRRLLGKSGFIRRQCCSEERCAREQGSTLAFLQRRECTFSLSLLQHLRKEISLLLKLHSTILDDTLWWHWKYGMIHATNQLYAQRWSIYWCVALNSSSPEPQLNMAALAARVQVQFLPTERCKSCLRGCTFRKTQKGGSSPQPLATDFLLSGDRQLENINLGPCLLSEDLPLWAVEAQMRKPLRLLESSRTPMDQCFNLKAAVLWRDWSI